MPPRHCLNWSVLQEFWHGPSLLPCRIEPSFFPGSSCHLHQKVNLFLFPITAFITWKWLLWKILIKHWLFPGWTETEHFNYSIAQDFVLCAAALECVCMGVCARMCFVVGQCTVAAAVSVSPSSTSSGGFSGAGCVWLMPCTVQVFSCMQLSLKARGSTGGLPCVARRREGGRHGWADRCVWRGRAVPAWEQRAGGSVTWQSIPTESVLPLRAGHSHRCLDVTWSAGMLCLSLLES